MNELSRGILFEYCYQYWAWACGWPSREEYWNTRLTGPRHNKT